MKAPTIYIVVRRARGCSDEYLAWFFDWQEATVYANAQTCTGFCVVEEVAAPDSDS